MRNDKELDAGILVISLDFELMWGVRDKKTINGYGEEILIGKQAILEMLLLFNKHNVKSTFATVGFLFHNDIKELMMEYPKCLPNYANEKFDPYKSISGSIHHYETNKDYYFCPELIQKIKENDTHEIATHTYSHYYCLETGQSIEEFDADILKAKQIAKDADIDLKSIVFPRNQYNHDYLKTCMSHGINCYRGNEDHFAFGSSNETEQTYLKRLVRLIDTYINITGYHCYDLKKISKEKPYNIPASRFLRPYSKGFFFLERLRLNRIKKAMTFAAKNNRLYHLWWHPHNFGRNLEKNLSILEELLNHYSYLKKKYDFNSLTMKEVGEMISRK